MQKRTRKQIAASRENGRQSHGAVTPEGQARIVNANLWSGIFAETQVLVWEHQEDLQELKDEYYQRHPPKSPEARFLVDQLINCEWQMRRFGYAEDSLWDQFAQTSPPEGEMAAAGLERGDHIFNRLQHRINSTRRAFLTALQQLERIEARDQHVTVAPKVDVTDSSETDLQTLGSLRKKDSTQTLHVELLPVKVPA
jgi:hypothetical protein